MKKKIAIILLLIVVFIAGCSNNGAIKSIAGDWNLDSDQANFNVNISKRGKIQIQVQNPHEYLSMEEMQEISRMSESDKIENEAWEVSLVYQIDQNKSNINDTYENNEKLYNYYGDADDINTDNDNLDAYMEDEGKSNLFIADLIGFEMEMYSPDSEDLDWFIEALKDEWDDEYGDMEVVEHTNNHLQLRFSMADLNNFNHSEFEYLTDYAAELALLQISDEYMLINVDEDAETYASSVIQDHRVWNNERR
ncbi:hypothetical protein [Oceanobacillus sp. J11TS1]|uniref:hypothetical protein n=1 Tax=Oceanobacillus sp. J11TS1 TaxID=2807191 RepID=UPI001B031675|nr:hypothetical protein [Oceanobacillus sp. J11TS1]GIO24036.1 hypothetical protein J11TS1_26170 [Oceanobacillus sp. J11TS1]